ncbi:glycerophosphodiester phosphodiesterase [Planctomicrobium sp. SH668]|uniref:glycerophosphodiester phosphodiesterase n=1 Tax=Planctomicrobium sp. SH668 TaxID=3448126 RepID=UPI003F5CB65A
MKLVNWLAGIAILGLCSQIPVTAVAQEKGLVYAHRGGAFEYEENTLSAIRTCYEKGIRGFEIDVRMTKDGELVVLHDDTLDRTHAGTGPVETKTAEEVRKIKTKKGESFLFLTELLDYLADKPGVYLELEMKTSKPEVYTPEILETYCQKIYDLGTSRQPEKSIYTFTSFDDRPLKIIKKNHPEADILYITGGACTPEFVEKAVSLGAKRIGVRMEGTSRAMVKEAQKAGLKVNGWPGRNLEDYHLAVGLGVDCICTDIPMAVLKFQGKLPE